LKRAVLAALLVFLASCGSTSPQRKKCEDKCAADLACPVGEPNLGCEAALADCQGDCADAPP